MANEGTANYVSSHQGAFSSDGYNEVDALIFAQLSYIRFEDYYSSSDSVTLGEFADKILKNSVNLKDDQVRLLEQIKVSPRYQNCKIHNMEVGDTSETQFAAITVDLDDGTSVVAMRGTDGTEMGWGENFEALRKETTPAQQQAKEYLEKCDASQIRMTGHSKGGNDCVAGYMMSDKETRNKVIQINNYDGPGVNDKMIEKYNEGYLELDEKLYNYYPENSIIGKLLNNNPGTNTTIVSNPDEKNAGVFSEHESFGFQVDGDSLVEGESSFLSDYLDNLLDETVADLNYDQKCQLVQLLWKTGVFKAIAGDVGFTETAKNVFVEIVLMTPEERALLVSILATLIYNAGKELVHTAVERAVTYIENVVIKFEEKLADYANRIREFCIQLKEKVTGLCQGFVDYYKNVVRTLFGGNYEFSVNLNDLESVSTELKSYKSQLEGLSYRMENVYNSLKFSEKFLLASSFKFLESDLRRYGKKCDKLADKLIDIKQVYISYEDKIVAFQG